MNRANPTAKPHAYIGAKTSARWKYIYIYIGSTYWPAYWSSKRSTQGAGKEAWRFTSFDFESSKSNAATAKIFYLI